MHCNLICAWSHAQIGPSMTISGASCQSPSIKLQRDNANSVKSMSSALLQSKALECYEAQVMTVRNEEQKNTSAFAEHS